jgi:thioredoxin 1
MAQQITDADFEQEVLKADLPVLVDFWAPWCGPCRSMLPLIDKLSSEYAGKVKVVKMNVDENSETPAKYGVMSIPAFFLFRDGKVVSSFVGAKSEEKMKGELDKVVEG